MRNIRLTLQYDGTDFSGLELQPGKITIRGELEKALFKLFKIRIKAISASRTDSGVHACCQVVSFPLINSIPIKNITKAINCCLPYGLRVIKAEEKPKKFHARYDAKSKEYEYLVFNGDILSPFCRNFVWHVKPKLNFAAMKKAAKVLVGKHDFSSFCASGGDDRNFVRIIYLLTIRNSELVIWSGVKCKVISIRVKGNGFLYKMVRNIVGTLVDVGLGRLGDQEVLNILKARNRQLAGRTAPAQGLCLLKINY